MLAGLVLRAIDDRLEPAGVEPEELPALPPDDRDERALAATDQRNQRREEQDALDLDGVRDRLRQRQRAPEVVQLGGEDGEAVRTVADELLLDVVLDVLEIRLQALPLLAGQLAPVQLLGRVAEQRVDASRGVARAMAPCSDRGRGRS